MPKRHEHESLVRQLNGIDVRYLSWREYQIAERFKRGGNVSHQELELLRAAAAKYTPY